MTKPTRKAAVLFTLIPAGLAGNYFNLPLFHHVDLLFGSIAVLLVVRLYGTAWGTLAAVVAGGYTYFSWNHPYAAVILACEALFVGVFLRRKEGNIILIDTAYWLCIGMPLAGVFYYGILGVGGQGTVMVMLKQGFNGIFNSLVAALLFNHLIRRFGETECAVEGAVSLKHTIFSILASVVLFPTLVVMVSEVRNDREYLESYGLQMLHRTSAMSRQAVGLWVEKHMHTVTALAALAGDPEKESVAEIQRKLELVKAAEPDFLRMSVCNRSAVSVAYYPLFDERGRSTVGVDFSDRAYFKELQRTLSPVISDVMVARLGNPSPVVVVAAPIVGERGLRGYAAGVVDPLTLGELLKRTAPDSSLTLTLLDRQKNAIIGTGRGAAGSGAYRTERGAEMFPLGPGTYRLMPAAGRNTSFLERWSNSFYVQEGVVSPSVPWTLVVAMPLAHQVSEMNAIVTRILSIALILTLLAVGSAHYASEALARPLARLVHITTSLPALLSDRSALEWPRSRLVEIADLIANFRTTAELLREKFHELQALNATLDSRIRERTEDLSRVNEELRAEVAMRRSAEESLKESEERWELALEGGDQGVWDWNLRTNEVFFSRRWKKMLGYENYEIAHSLGEWERRIHPEDLAPTLDAVRKYLAGETPFYSTEHRMKCKDGSYVWILDQGKVVSWTDDLKPLRMVGTHTDITERKRDEALLKINEKQYKKIFENMPIGAFIAGHGGAIVRVNKAFCTIVDRSEEELLSLSPDDYTQPGDPSADPRTADSPEGQVLRGELDTCLLEKRYLRKDGESRLASQRLLLMRTEQGEPYYVIGIAEDITERRWAQEELRKTRDRLAEAQRLARIGNWEWDVRSGRRWWSDEFYRIFGLDPQGVPADYEFFLGCIHPGDRDATRGALSAALQERKDYAVDYRIVKADAEERTIHAQGRIVYDEAGAPERVLGTVQDVTEFRKAEEALRFSREQMRNLAAHLESAREAERTTIAREIHDELGQALTGLKLDLTALSRNIGMLDIEEKSALLAGAGSLSGCIDDIVEIVHRIAMELRPGILDHLGLVAAVEWQVADFQKRTGIRASLSGDEHLTLSRDLATALFRILQESLTNVARHAGATRVAVVLREQEDTLVLEVRDNGRGITEQEMRTSRSFGLLGMRERAEMLGGRVTLTGIPGEGTTLVASIPKKGEDHDKDTRRG